MSCHCVTVEVRELITRDRSDVDEDEMKWELSTAGGGHNTHVWDTKDIVAKFNATKVSQDKAVASMKCSRKHKIVKTFCVPVEVCETIKKSLMLMTVQGENSDAFEDNIVDRSKDYNGEDDFYAEYNPDWMTKGNMVGATVAKADEEDNVCTWYPGRIIGYSVSDEDDIEYHVAYNNGDVE